MNNSLDEQIRKQAELFDNVLPPVGHFERFEQKLERHEKHKTLHWRRWVTVTAIAAMVAVILMFQYSQPIRPTDIYPESTQEVAAYYNRQLQEEIGRIEQETQDMDEADRQEVISDIEKMKTEFQHWEKPATQMPEEERIAWIVTRYNVQMESLQNLHSLLKEIPNQPEHKL